jgi:DNA-binding PadR family transcriptional regulator
MTRSALGEFEHLVLLTMLQLGGKTRSAPIVVELEQRLGRQVAPAAVYIALRRLEKRGLLLSEKHDPAPKEGGRGKRVFETTPLALDKLREARGNLETLWEGLDPLFQES